MTGKMNKKTVQEIYEQFEKLDFGKNGRFRLKMTNLRMSWKRF